MSSRIVFSLVPLAALARDRNGGGGGGGGGGGMGKPMEEAGDLTQVAVAAGVREGEESPAQGLARKPKGLPISGDRRDGGGGARVGWVGELGGNGMASARYHASARRDREVKGGKETRYFVKRS